MLVLTDTDGLGIDLHQFRQGILQSSGDRCGASLTNVKIGKLFCRQLTCGVYGSTCLVDDHILYRTIQFLQQLYDYLLGLSGSCTVSYRN